MKRSAFPALLFVLLFLCFVSADPGFSETGPRANDSITVAEFFGDTEGEIAPNLTPPPAWTIGRERDFRVLNIASGVMNVCKARIFLITDNAVFWYDTDAVLQIPDPIIEGLRNFEAGVLPMLRKTFGTENNPGIDNDPRFHVLFTDKIGSAYNGYFSAEDSADPRIRPVSNHMELLFLNTRLLEQGTGAVTDTLSHEFQHMIHFNYDRNEQDFVNEGLSGLAEYLALGKIKDIFIRNYLTDTGKSLIWWSDSGTNSAYYGSSFLFSMYLFEHYGEEFIRDLVSCTENGLDSIDTVLRKKGLTCTADDVFQQWTAALMGNLMQRPVRDWDYRSYRFPQDGIYRDIRNTVCGVSGKHESAQYGIHIYYSTCVVPFRIRIDGTRESPTVPLKFPGGSSAWWSGAVSNSMAILSRDFDLTAATTPVILEYDTNFAIEENYDYYYLLLREQDGTVTRLSPSTCTEYNPAQLNRGNGTTGNSNGTIREAIDLSQWAGENIRISFVYLTDTATVSEGLLLDNFRIEAIGFRDDAEAGDNGWEAEGFSRIRSSVPQNYSLVVLHPQNDGTATAEFHIFEGGVPFTTDCPEGNCLFAVSAVNRNIRSRAAYTVYTEPHQKD